MAIAHAIAIAIGHQQQQQSSGAVISSHQQPSWLCAERDPREDIGGTSSQVPDSHSSKWGGCKQISRKKDGGRRMEDLRLEGRWEHVRWGCEWADVPLRSVAGNLVMSNAGVKQRERQR